MAEEIPVRDPVTGFCIECPAGESGELIAPIDNSDPMKQFHGYSDPAATAKKVLTDVFAKGDMWFRTGDLLLHDTDGWIYFKDRIGDTFRWKGENVSTNEVSEVVSTFPGVLEANIYGVQIPGSEDGRACMAAVVTENSELLDMSKLLEYMRQDLASYALPQFIRYLPEMESTGTFKQRKVDYQKEGIDIAVVTDRMFWLDPKSGAYEPLTREAYGKICQGKARL